MFFSSNLGGLFPLQKMLLEVVLLLAYFLDLRRGLERPERFKKREIATMWIAWGRKETLHGSEIRRTPVEVDSLSHYFMVHTCQVVFSPDF